MKLKMKLNSIYILIGTVVLSSCVAGPDNPGVEFAPQMYHSTPYEALSQVTDKEAGAWLSSTDNEGHSEFYNSNRYNDFGMTMREPVAGTIKRGQYLPIRFDPDDFESAEKLLVNPLDSTAATVADGKTLFGRFCVHCHGKEGLGDGKVGKVFLGVTPFTSASVIDKGTGHIYQVITNGKGRMGSHASQISPMERWKIAMYVKVLQQ
jgi:mono/diheme cytochrome c family protein